MESGHSEFKIVNEKDENPIEDVCGPLREVYQSKNLSLATIVIKPGHKAGSHKHSYLEEVYLVRKGRGLVWVGEESYKIKKGDVFSIPLNIFHHLENPYKRGDLEVIVVTHPKFTQEDVIREEN